MNQNANRYYDLDLLRFLAAIFVVFYHYTYIAYNFNDFTPLSFPAMAQFFRYGSFGVELFFIISGYVIFMSAYSKGPLGFVIGRISRLYPAYWFAMCLTTLCWWLSGQDKFAVELKQFLANLSMVHGYFWIKSVDGVYWTLMYEIKFYFLVFLVLSFKALDKAVPLLALWLSLVSLQLLGINHNALEFFTFPQYAAFFIAGSLYFLIKQEGMSKLKLALLAWSFVLACYTAVQNHVYEEGSIVRHLSLPIVLAIVAGLYLLFFAVALRKTGFINHPRMVLLGALTYPLYLIHQNIGYMIFNILAPYWNKYLILGFTIALMLLASYAIHRWIEQPYCRGLSQALKLLVQRTPLLRRIS